MAKLQGRYAGDGATLEIVWCTDFDSLPETPGTDILFKCRRPNGTIYHVIELVHDDGRVWSMHWDREVLGWIELPPKDDVVVGWGVELVSEK